MKTEIEGIVPVMLTPFTENGDIDIAGLDRLVEWYLHQNPGALFAVCQSSEMQKLSLKERLHVAKSVVAQTKGRVPVLACGHIADTFEDQSTELACMADTGIDVLVLVTNRLATNQQGSDVFRHNLRKLLDALPSDLPLGLYECPAPFRRLISDDELEYCRDTGRFVVLKDVSCDLETVKRRLKLVEDTRFSIINANAAIAHSAMRAGSRGFVGVFTNFHTDLYAWLYENRNCDDPLVGELANFLALSACAEPMGYPGLAKIYHQKIGTFDCINSRVISGDIREKYWAIDAIIDHIHTGTEAFRARINPALDKTG
jgi:4-hydroxy-tetrahydrodipicolinate synthase